jgi:hypothetical protein
MAWGSFFEVRNLDPERSSRLVRLATAGVVAYGANLLVAALFRMAVEPIEHGHLAQAVVATVLVLGPAVWLMWAAAHNAAARTRPVALLTAATLILAALPVIGPDWLGSFVTLSALAEIVARGEHASDLAAHDPAAAEAALASLVDDARRTLAQARHLVRRYQTVTLRAEVQAAVALLSAAGIQARIVLPPDEPPAAALESLRAQLRAYTARLLSDDTIQRCVITVDRHDGRLDLHVHLEPATVPPAGEEAG